MSQVYENIDVICEHKSDGSIVPMRVRFLTEDGEYQTFNIKGYREASKKGAYTTQDGIYVCESSFVFECMLVVLNSKKMVRLYYNSATDVKWKLAI